MYSTVNDIIPQSKRAMINEKIIALINSNSNVVSKNDIYNAYTGVGGLHGLNFSSFENFHSYTEAKKEFENGQFFTPPSIVSKIMGLLNIQNDELVCDLTCGHGSFINYTPIQSNFFGCEIDKNSVKVGRHLYPDAQIEFSDVRYYNPDVAFDFVVGNPPFNLNWKGESSQLFYCKKAFDVLKPSGIMAIVVPNSFLNDDFYNKTQIDTLNERFGFIGGYKLIANAFENIGVSNFPTKVLFFQKKSKHIDAKGYDNSLVLNALTDGFYSSVILPVREQQRKLKAKLFLELNHKGSDGFSFKVKKYLFEIKTHPQLKVHYAKAVQLVERFNNQVKPDDIDWKEWEQKRLTEAKVLFRLKDRIEKQNVIEKDKIRLVKTNYGFKLKAYSNKSKKALSNFPVKCWSINDMVYYPDGWKIPTQFNVDVLTNLISKTIITRKFKDLVGKDKYTPVVRQIEQHQQEVNVYDVIINEFYTIVNEYFASTGDYRKDSYLKIIRQINLLIKACSVPHTFSEYTSLELPSKFKEILNLLGEFKNEKVAVGCTTKQAANLYFEEIQNTFNRPVFYIDGEKTSFKKRQLILKEFEQTNNGVLICTQQSLKSSANIPSCNKVIIESVSFPKNRTV